MRRSRAIRFACWFGLTLAALGCTQIAGLTGDYHLAEAGAGGASGGRSGAGAGSGVGASGGVNASGDAGDSADAGASGDSSPSGGAAGASGGALGASGASGGALGTNGGASGASGGAAGGGGGAAGVAGAGGGTVAGPARVGFSEFHDSASGGDNASAHLTNATFAKPAGTAGGDLILVFFGADHSLENLSGPDLTVAGWTLVDQHAQYGTDGQATYLMYKVAGVNEPDPIVFTGINSPGNFDGVQGLLSVYRGVSAISPINAYEVLVTPTGNDVTQVATATPAITTTVANCLLIAGLSPDTTIDAPVISAWPQGFVENLVSVNNPAHPYPFGWANIYSAERHLPAAGTVPVSEFDWTVSNGTGYFGALSFVLALAPSP